MSTWKSQILVIHWWMTFRRQEDYLLYLETRRISIEKQDRWSGAYLDRELWDDFDIIRPRMPLQDNATYTEWKLHFERHFEFLTDGIILIWGSLGWVFLAKYLSENIFPKKIKSVYLVCPPFDNTLIGEELVGWFGLGNNLLQIEKNCNDVALFFSKDDDCVPVSHAEKYRNKLEKSTIIIYESKGWHFNISEFPEIIEMIKPTVWVTN
jgi:predicted alpha/beta hydrolase family esterase